MADIFTQPVDQAALTLARAIALKESGSGGLTPNYNAVGDAGTSKGAYQWQPGNFEAGASKYGLNPKDFSPENQDKVAYAQVLDMKNRGLQPDQIAASWNAGEGSLKNDRWKTNVGDTTIKGQKIHYDTPGYVKGVQDYYNQLFNQGNGETPQAPVAPPVAPAADMGQPAQPQGDAYQQVIDAIGQPIPTTDYSQVSASDIGQLGNLSASDIPGIAGEAALDAGKMAVNTAKGAYNLAVKPTLQLPETLAGIYNQGKGLIQDAGGDVNAAAHQAYAGLNDNIDNFVHGIFSAGLDKAKQILTNPLSTINDIHKLAIEHPFETALAAKSAFDYANKLSAPQVDTQGNPVAGTGMPKVQSTLKAVDTGVQTIASPVTTAVDTIVGKATGLAEDFSRNLEETNLRLTPAQKAKLGSRLQDVVDWTRTNLKAGTPEERYAQATDIYNAKEDTLQSVLQNEAQDNVVSTQQLEDRLNNLKIKYSASDVADLEQAGKQIDSAIKRLGAYGDEVPVPRLNNLKRDIFSSAYNKAGDKVLDWVEHDIGDVYKGAIEENLGNSNIKVDGKPIADFNKDYGQAIQARKILRIAEGRQQIGFTGRLASKVVGGLIGSLVGGLPGEVAGTLLGDTVAEKVGGTKARSAVSKILQKGKN